MYMYVYKEDTSNTILRKDITKQLAKKTNVTE